MTLSLKKKLIVVRNKKIEKMKQYGIKETSESNVAVQMGEQ